jgi:hypothetical protein
MSPLDAAAKLKEIGELEAADALERGRKDTGTISARALGDWLPWPFQDRPWQHAEHAFGYLRPAREVRGLRKIYDVGSINADESLKNSRVRITLDALRVFEYPGKGIHNILFDFYARNQLKNQSEHLHFHALYRVRDDDHAAIRGFPIFLGLNTGVDGVAFRCYTVNVRNDRDQAFLSFLESDVFRSGLKLATSAQPVLAPFANMAFGLTKAIASRNQNVPVQEFFLGLDFSQNAMGASLAEGSYISVQVPGSANWRWDEWVFDPASARIVAKTDRDQTIPFNYIVFGVSRYQGDR